MKRRNFLKLAGIGTSGIVAPQLSRAETLVVKPGFVQEVAREIPVVEEFDVIVCGAGPAGVAAAIAAGRSGAKTLLIEVCGCLGGIWTAGILSYILDYANKKGLMQEIFAGIEKLNGRTVTKSGKPTNTCDVEIMKVLLEDMCTAAGLQILLHTRVCAALKNVSGRVEHVITESKSGREAFRAKLFIDCTGDGDLAAYAGCGFDMGQAGTGNTQPMSLIALLMGISAGDIGEFYRSEDSAASWASPKDKLKAEMERGGHSPSYGKPSLFRVYDDLFMLMANHEYGVKGTSVRDITNATIRARKELHNLINGLRSLGGIWKNLRIVATAEQIGVREGRRIHGMYTVTQNDLAEGKTHEDAVCRATFGIDVHSTDPKKEKGIEKAPVKAKPYDIPIRALIARDVGGLMMAGRCISGDFIAHSSYRVTGNSVALGEAAGKVAALAAKNNCLPQNVKIPT